MKKIAKKYGWKPTYSYTPIKDCKSLNSWLLDNWIVISLYLSWKHQGWLVGWRFFGITKDWVKI